MTSATPPEPAKYKKGDILQDQAVYPGQKVTGYKVLVLDDGVWDRNIWLHELQVIDAGVPTELLDMQVGRKFTSGEGPDWKLIGHTDAPPPTPAPVPVPGPGPSQPPAKPGCLFGWLS